MSCMVLVLKYAYDGNGTELGLCFISDLVVLVEPCSECKTLGEFDDVVREG